MAECFTDDAVAAYSGGKYSYEGRDAILAFLRSRWAPRRSSRATAATTPRSSSPRPTTATAVWALEDVVIEEKWGITIRGAAFYRDEYVKQDGALAHPAHRLQAHLRGDPVAQGRARPAPHRELVGHGRPERAAGGLEGARVPREPGCAVVRAFLARRLLSELRAARVHGLGRLPARSPLLAVPGRGRPRDAAARSPLACSPSTAAGASSAGRRGRRTRPTDFAEPGFDDRGWADDRRAGRLDAPGLRPPALHERRDAVRAEPPHGAREESDRALPHALRAARGLRRPPRGARTSAAPRACSTST